MTFCDTPAPTGALRDSGPLPPGPSLHSTRSRLPTALARESRAYFRCHPLVATISVQQCRANRARLSPAEALSLPWELPSWWVQPSACWSCALAPQVEAGQVPFFTVEEVLAGCARAAPASAVHSPSPAA